MWKLSSTVPSLAILSALVVTTPAHPQAGEDDGLVLPGESSLSDATPVAVRVMPQEPRHPVHRALLGTNHNWIWSNEYGGSDDEDNINEAFFEELTGFPIPLARMSGTGSQFFNWKLAVGPISERPKQQIRPNDKKGIACRYGPLEWVKSVRMVEPGAEFAWVLNLREDSPADHADLAELFGGDGEENPNGGRDWAKLRIDYGLKDPVEVSIWELGNELEHSRWGVDYEQYAAWCREAIDAVRSVDPDARFAALAATSPWRPTRDPDVDWKDWHRSLLRDFGDELDYLVFHPYYHGINAVRMSKYIDEITDDIKEITGSDRIRMYISEHARWPGRSEPTKNRPRGDLEGWQTHSMEGCVATSEFLNLMFNDPMITAAGYHSLSGGPWNVIKAESGSDDFYLTGMAETLKFYDDALGDEVLTVRTSGERADPDAPDLSFSALAMADGESIHLVLTNRDKTSTRIADVSVDGPPRRLASAEILTAPSADSHNNASESPIQRLPLAIEDLSLDRLPVPPHSIVVLRLQD